MLNYLVMTGETPTPVESITTDLVAALQDAGNSITSAIGDILPVALGVFAVFAVVTIGIGVFRKVTGAKKAPTA